MDAWNIALGLLSFGTLSLSFKQQLNINATDRKLKQLLKTKSYSPKDLISGIQDKEAYLINQFKEYSRNEISGKVFIDGVVSTDFPITSHLTRQKLLHSIYFKKDIFSNDRLRAANAQKAQDFPSNSQQEKAPNFYLSDYEGSHKCLVANNGVEEADFRLALEILETKEEERKLNIVEKFFVFVLMVFDIASRIEGSLGFRGIKVGVRETEIGIKLDSFLTVFGEVIYNFEKKTIRIENPEYLLKNKRDLLESLKDYISSCKTSRFLWGFLGITCLSILGYRIYRKKSRQAVGN